MNPDSRNILLQALPSVLSSMILPPVSRHAQQEEENIDKV